MIGIVGAGLSGSIIARELAEAGIAVRVFDSRNHIAGNCYSSRDEDTNIMIHHYGPHIFHTDDRGVWDYVNTYADFLPYTHQVKTTVVDNIYSLPINLHTINQYFGAALNPLEASKVISMQGDPSIKEPKNFEEQAIKMVGHELYAAFFKGYTKKQWGCDPKQLPASILKRLPVRFSYNDNYFFHKFQGIPRDGYTNMVEKILAHPNIDVVLGKTFAKEEATKYEHVFFSGAIDAYYNYEFGRLTYRSLKFERIDYDGDYQGCAVMNYGDEEIPYTRIAEHKFFTPWEPSTQSVCFKEYSVECGPEDTPYYPVRLSSTDPILETYIIKARENDQVTFVGRLGRYKYLDMDAAIREALDVARDFLIKT